MSANMLESFDACYGTKQKIINIIIIVIIIIIIIITLFSVDFHITITI